MSALVRLLGTFAPGHVLAHAGRDFTFGRIDQRTKAALTVAYFRRARETVYAIKGEVDQADYDRQLGRVLDAYRKGEYAFVPGMESFAYFLGQGLAELVCHLTGCTDALAHALIEEKGVEVLHLCLCLTYESLGEEDKKKLLAQEGTPAMRQLAEVLSSYSTPPPTSNGSSCSPSTRPPASPEPASTPTSSPA